MITDRIQFSSQIYYNCLQQVLDSVMRAEGWDLSLVLFNDWLFSCRWRDGLCRASAMKYDDVWVKFAEEGVRLETHEPVGDGGDWDRILRHMAESGKPTPVRLDTFYLDYFRKVDRYHAAHTVVLVDYDQRADAVLLVDVSHKHKFRGWVPRREVVEGFTSTSPALRRSNYWLELELRGSQGQWSESGIVRERLRKNIESMAGVDSTRGSGIAGMEKYCEAIGKWAEAVDEGQLRFAISDMRRTASYRNGYAHFLGAVGRRLDDCRLEEVGRKMEIVSHNWLLVGNMLHKGIIGDTPGMLRRIQKRFQSIVQAESAAIDELCGIAA